MQETLINLVYFWIVLSTLLAGITYTYSTFKYDKYHTKKSEVHLFRWMILPLHIAVNIFLFILCASFVPFEKVLLVTKIVLIKMYDRLLNKPDRDYYL